MPELAVQEQLEKTTSYRVYLYPTLVAKIRDCARTLNIDERRLCAVWLAETVEAKRAQMGMARQMGDVVGQQVAAAVADALAIAVQVAEREAQEVEQTG